MYNLIIPCNMSLSHIIVPKYCYVGVSLASNRSLEFHQVCMLYYNFRFKGILFLIVNGYLHLSCYLDTESCDVVRSYCPLRADMNNSNVIILGEFQHSW